MEKWSKNEQNGVFRSVSSRHKQDSNVRVLALNSRTTKHVWKIIKQSSGVRHT